MSHRPEVADVFRGGGTAFLDRYGSTLSFDQHRALRAIALCRTRALGGHLARCDSCGYAQPSYNSCRNRHCPKCQASARAAWMEARAAELLPVPYFHVVFTLPHQLGPLALQNKKAVYGFLLRAAWETVRDLARDPKYLGAQVGMLSVLHTWGSNLMHHPHVHGIVPGGGVSPDGQRWISVKRSPQRKAFFLPVRVMSRVFRGKFLQHLKRAYCKGQLSFHGRLSALCDPHRFESLLNASVKNDWVVYCKRPFGGPTQVLKYLARYTHRVAIANNRLVSHQNGVVRFRWKDYRNSGQTKVMQVAEVEFIRRFLLHVLPAGFVKIRHHGFLANRNRGENLNRCRRLLGVEEPAVTTASKNQPCPDESAEALGTENVCPKCQTGRMQTRLVAPLRRLPTRIAFVRMANGLDFQDSS